MAEKIIPQLTEGTTIDSNSLLVFDSGIQTFKITAPNLAAGLKALAASPIVPSKSANYSPLAAQADSIIRLKSAAGSFNVQLPDPSTMAGKGFRLVDEDLALDQYPVTLVRAAAEKIAGLTANFALNASGGKWYLWTDGTDWFFI